MKKDENLKIMPDKDYEQFMRKKKGAEEEFAKERARNKVNYENYLKRQEMYERKYTNKQKSKKLHTFICLVIIIIITIYVKNPELIKMFINSLIN